MAKRTETDTFGPIQVDDDRYWGAQAERSLGNFKIGWEKQPASIVRALGIVKKAAAITNMALGQLDPAIGNTIVAAAEEVMSGKLNAHLAEIDRTARQRVEQTVTAMAQAEGVTEELKAADPMKWVGLMNDLRSAAEETVLAELIYN